MHLFTCARRSQARGGLAAHLREPSQVVFLALLGLVAFGWALVALDGGQFLTMESVVGIQQRSAALGIVAIGQTLAILAGSLDLSVAYLISLSSLVAAEIMAGQDGNIGPAVAAVLIISSLVGLVNGLVITRLQVHAFIATLGVALIIKGVVDHLYDGPAGRVPESFQLLGYSRVGPVPVSAMLWAGVAVVAWFLLSRTRLGYRIYAVGGNEEVARLSGIRTARVIVITHVLCSVCSGIAGLLLAVLDTLFNQLEVNSFVKDVVRGVVIVIAVAVYARRRARRSA
jgi:ribose transport system permease protein